MKFFHHIRFSDRRGIALVWLALFLLPLLIIFAGLAIDIAYMYYAKNQLQVAADASALAGAGVSGFGGVDDITADPNILLQTAARQEAWRFACKNTAVADEASVKNVYLATDSPSDCDSETPPAASALNGLNNANGDIVVGHWTPPPAPGGISCEPAGSGFFCRATGSTGLSINAVKTVARRTFAAPVPGVSIGNNPVQVFFGQIFRIFGEGYNWSFMNAVSSAVAAPQPPQVGPFPTCLPSCGLLTPLKTEWGYNVVGNPNDPLNPHHPILCTDPNLPTGDGNSNSDDSFPVSATPGQKFFLNSSSEGVVIKKPGLAWTNFYINDCLVSPSCNQPTPGEVMPYITGAQEPPDICGEHICTTNGTMIPALTTVDTEFSQKSRPVSIGPQTINGWQLFVPIVSDESCGPSAVCPGDPSGPANPYLVEQYMKMVITDVITTGQQGFRLVGLDNPRQMTVTFQCREGGNLNTKTITRWVSDLTCSPCEIPLTSLVTPEPHLVK
jgi:hypothetical protein